MCFQKMCTMTFLEVLKISYFDEEQTFTDILLKSCSEEFSKIHRKTYVLESILNTQNSLEDTWTGFPF